MPIHSVSKLVLAKFISSLIKMLRIIGRSEAQCKNDLQLLNIIISAIDIVIAIILYYILANY